MKLIRENSGLISICCLLIGGLFIRPNVAYNATESLPKGFYLMGDSQNNYSKGDLVLFRQAKAVEIGEERGYINKGQSLGKRIVAVEGDSINVSEEGVLNGGERLSLSIPAIDSKGREMNLFYFDGVVPESSVFVLGDSEKSFDSRYYGFVHTSEISNKISPVWVW